jgi:hypothetical protein
VILIVPTFSDDSYVQQTTLEGTTYTMQFDFNQRCACWYMHLADQDGVDIYNGVKLVTGFSLLRKCKDPRAPAGALFVNSSTADLSPPDLFDLVPGGRCQLMYLTSDWIALLVQPGGLDAILAQLAANAQASTTSTYGQAPTAGS